MKQSTLVTKITMLVLCLGVLAYLGFYIIQYFSDDLSTVYAYAATERVGTHATGIIIREETVLTGSSQWADLVPDEGEKVGVGQTVARLYSSEDGFDKQQQAESLSSEIQQLQYSLSSGTASGDTAKLDEGILTAIAALHADASEGSLSGLSDSTFSLRTQVFRRDYIYGDTAAATAVSDLITQRQSELDTLKSSLNSSTTTVTAPVSGTFSGEVDGFETLITPAMIPDLTPSTLVDIMGQSPEPAAAVGKLITSATWYFATVLGEDAASSLREGNSYTLSFTRDYSGEIPMTLYRLSDAADGQRVAVFAANRNLSETTLLRQQTVDIVKETVTGIRVPRKALRVVTSTSTAEDGTTSTVTTPGVYTLVSAQAEFQPVTILYQTDDYYIVSPADPEAAHRLRAGDQVIVTTRDLFNGKVVR